MMPEIKFESQEKKYVANFKLYFLLTLGIKVYDLSENAAKQIWLDVTRRGETYSKMYSKKFVMLYNITTFVKPILIQTYMMRDNGYFDPLTWKKKKKKYELFEGKSSLKLPLHHHNFKGFDVHILSWWTFYMII